MNDTSPWFGTTFKKVNTENIKKLNSDELTSFLKFLFDENVDIQKRIRDISLTKGKRHIKGVGVGIVTLFFYITNKDEYTIWFEALHNGLNYISKNFTIFLHLKPSIFSSSWIRISPV